MEKVILLTEKGASANRMMGRSAKAGDPYTGKPSRAAFRQYIRQGFICEAIPVEDQGRGILYDTDGTSYVGDGNGKIISISGGTFEAASWDEHDNVTAIKAV